MLRKILIANRGEIACRIIDTAGRLGIETVAVFSDADATALHVARADTAVRIGGPAPADSYLRGDRIIEAALATGAQAIHPGYGFLSENPDFVEAVEAAGLIFIGPSADAIRAMGLKDAAKALMEGAGVPVVPGYHGTNQDPEHLSGAADAIGYPVLIKAVAGGGGKGMRKVETPEGFQEALDSARGEAATAFGNDAVLIEKFVEKPRHIEVQVFGDGARAIHLFERDCSLQRRHQKVIEEAPAPGMTDEMRAAMGQAATRAAEAIGYRGAGTVEFIVDASDGLRPDRFWFMEMNTRLQVEHPVTEAVTGVDLVEWQLRVAAGEPLPARQEDLRVSGHAVEARLYAEDVPGGFLPATGRLDHLRFPDGARCDTGVRAGDAISPWYDPMIAKVIVHGPTRASALGQLRHALSHTQIAGTVTNLAFLRRLVGQVDVVAGDLDTGLIDRHLDELAPDPEPCTRSISLAALGALGLSRPADAARGFTLWQPLRRRAVLEHSGERREVEVEMIGPERFRTRVGETRHEIDRRDGAWWVDGMKTVAEIVTTRARISVFWGNCYHFGVPDPLTREDAAHVGGDCVDAPMPGIVKTVYVSEGALVGKGDRLMVIEAMKMEHALTAARAGRIAEVLAQAGTQVEAGAPLIRMEEEA